MWRYFDLSKGIVVHSRWINFPVKSTSLIDQWVRFHPKIVSWVAHNLLLHIMGICVYINRMQRTRKYIREHFLPTMYSRHWHTCPCHDTICHANDWTLLVWVYARILTLLGISSRQVHFLPSQRRYGCVLPLPPSRKRAIVVGTFVGRGDWTPTGGQKTVISPNAIFRTGYTGVVAD